MRGSPFRSPAFGGGVMLAPVHSAHSPHSSPPPPPPRTFPQSSSPTPLPAAAVPPPVRRSSLSHALGTAPPSAPSACSSAASSAGVVASGDSSHPAACASAARMGECSGPSGVLAAEVCASSASASASAGAGGAPAVSSSSSSKSGRWDFFRWADEEDEEDEEEEEVAEVEEGEEDGREEERGEREGGEGEYDYSCAGPAGISGNELRWGRESERMSASFSDAQRGGSRMAVAVTRSDSSLPITRDFSSSSRNLSRVSSSGRGGGGSNNPDRGLSAFAAATTATTAAPSYFPRRASCPASPSHKAPPPEVTCAPVEGSTAGGRSQGRSPGGGGIVERGSHQRDQRNLLPPPVGGTNPRAVPSVPRASALPPPPAAAAAAAPAAPAVCLTLAEPYSATKSAQSMIRSNAPAPCPVPPPAPPPVLDLLSAVRAGLEAGAQPVSARGGLGGAYIFRDESCANLAIVKPTDEEPLAPNNPNGYVGRALGQPGLKRSIRVGEAAGREVAAYVLDHGGFAGVPCTALVWAAHPAFHVNAPQRHAQAQVQAQTQAQEQQATAMQEVRLCSLQRYEEHDYDASEHGTSRFPVGAVHRMGILDVRLLNTDRHSGNILVKKLSSGGGGGGAAETEDRWRRSFSHSHAHLRGDDAVRLIPIDHGFCLPEALESAYFEWLHWPQASLPFSPDELEYIAALDASYDMRLLQSHLPAIRPGCLRVLAITTALLQRAAAAGMTLAGIGALMTREVQGREERPSDLELACWEALQVVARGMGREMGRGGEDGVEGGIAEESGGEGSEEEGSEEGGDGDWACPSWAVDGGECDEVASGAAAGAAPTAGGAALSRCSSLQQQVLFAPKPGWRWADEADDDDADDDADEAAAAAAADASSSDVAGNGGEKALEGSTAVLAEREGWGGNDVHHAHTFDDHPDHPDHPEADGAGDGDVRSPHGEQFHFDDDEPAFLQSSSIITSTTTTISAAAAATAAAAAATSSLPRPASLCFLDPSVGMSPCTSAPLLDILLPPGATCSPALPALPAMCSDDPVRSALCSGFASSASSNQHMLLPALPSLPSLPALELSPYLSPLSLAAPTGSCDSLLLAQGQVADEGSLLLQGTVLSLSVSFPAFTAHGDDAAGTGFTGSFRAWNSSSGSSTSSTSNRSGGEGFKPVSDAECDGLTGSRSAGAVEGKEEQEGREGREGQELEEGQEMRVVRRFSLPSAPLSCSATSSPFAATPVLLSSSSSSSFSVDPSSSSSSSSSSFATRPTRLSRSPSARTPSSSSYAPPSHLASRALHRRPVGLARQAGNAAGRGSVRMQRQQLLQDQQQEGWQDDVGGIAGGAGGGTGAWMGEAGDAGGVAGGLAAGVAGAAAGPGEWMDLGQLSEEAWAVFLRVLEGILEELIERRCGDCVTRRLHFGTSCRF
ncbi:hypothetical protein CLOM_g16355 [Closterium sp. NIES-68]|nr:hypothetical protein CLOM_g16355 [Closterium sp. NIES-68]